MKTNQKSVLLVLVLAALAASCSNPASDSTPAGKSPVAWGTVSYTGISVAAVQAGSSGNVSVADSSAAGIVELQLPSGVATPTVTVTVWQSVPGYATWQYNSLTRILTVRTYEPSTDSPYYALVRLPFSFVVY